MDLTKHKGKGGEWLRAGVYVGRICKMEQVRAQTGSTGIELYFKDNASGKMAKNRYWLKDGAGNDSKALWRLEQVASAIKLTDEQMRTFNPKMLANGECAFVVQLQKGQDRYHEVGECATVEEKGSLRVPAPPEPKTYTTPVDEFDGAFEPFDGEPADTTEGF